MGINEFRAFALQTLCEAHNWEPMQTEFFTLKGWEYRIRKEPDGMFSLTERASKYDMWPGPDEFKTMGRLFAFIFASRCISYN